MSSENKSNKAQVYKSHEKFQNESQISIDLDLGLDLVNKHSLSHHQLHIYRNKDQHIMPAREKK